MHAKERRAHIEEWQSCKRWQSYKAGSAQRTSRNESTKSTPITPWESGLRRNGLHHCEASEIMADIVAACSEAPRQAPLSGIDTNMNLINLYHKERNAARHRTLSHAMRTPCMYTSCGSQCI